MRRALRRRLALLAALALGPPALARSDPPSLAAPLGITTPGPIRQLFLDPVLTDARAVGRLELVTRLETGQNWSVPTYLARGGRLVLVQTDVQADALILAVRIPWSIHGGGEGWLGRVATTVGWRVTGFWGGFEDPWIEAWHHLIGSTNFLRDRYPQNQVRLRLEEIGGAALIDMRSGRLSPGDLVVATQVLLAAGGSSPLPAGAADDPAWGVAARLDLKLPTGALSRAGGSGGVDAAATVQGSWDVTPWLTLHGRLTAGVVSALPGDFPLQPNRVQGGAEISAVFQAWGWALVLEDRTLMPLCQGGWQVLDGGNNLVHISSAAAALFLVHNQISGGLRRGPFTLYFSEDFTPGPNPWGKARWFYDSNAPDVVLGLTLTLPL